MAGELTGKQARPFEYRGPLNAMFWKPWGCCYCANGIDGAFGEHVQGALVT